MQPEFATSVPGSPLQGGRPMTRRYSPWRTAALLVAGALIFALAGDRGFTATSLGIDPLEVLDLQVKPNVFVVLDTSGSMEDLTNDSASNYGGDHIRSKMWQAKQVLKSVFQANQDKASFMFGVYRFSGAAPDPRGNMAVGNVSGTGVPARFVYSAQSWGAGTFPNPACTVDPLTCPAPNPATVTVAGPGWVAFDGHDRALRQLALRVPVDPERRQHRQQHAGLHRAGEPGLHRQRDAGLLHQPRRGRHGDPERDELVRGARQHVHGLRMEPAQRSRSPP